MNEVRAGGTDALIDTRASGRAGPCGLSGNARRALIRLRINTCVVQAAPLVAREAQTSAMADWAVKSSIPPWGLSAKVSLSISARVNEIAAAADLVDVRDVPEEVRADGAQETTGQGS